MASLQERSRKMREKREAKRLKSDKIRKEAREKYTPDELRKGRNRLAADLKMEENKARLKNPGENPKVKKRIAEEQARLKKDVETRTNTFGPNPKPKPKPKPAPKPKANRATDKGGREAAPGSKGYKPTNTKIGPNMNKVNKPDAKPDAKPAPKKEEKFDRMQAARDQMKRARASMGFKKGGKVRGDGICKKGRTKGRFV